MPGLLMQSPMAIPVFFSALLGAWPNATTTESAEVSTVEVFEASVFPRAPALSVAMFTGESETLWPILLNLKVVDLDEDRVVLEQEVRVVDGQEIGVDEVAETPTGERIFSLSATARHHVGEAIEVDWELELHESGFADLDWENYLLHRFNLGPRPALERPTLRSAQADIVELQQDPHRVEFSVGDRDYVVIIAARDGRG
jgi:hypothetical protein